MVCANILPVQLHEWTKYQSRGKPCKNLFKESAHQKSSSYKGGGKTHSVPPLLFSTQLTESNGSANDTQQPFRSFLSAFEQATVSTNQHNPTQKPTRTPTPIHTTHVPYNFFVIDGVRQSTAATTTNNERQQRTNDDERRRTTTTTTNDKRQTTNDNDERRTTTTVTVNFAHSSLTAHHQPTPTIALCDSACVGVVQ